MADVVDWDLAVATGMRFVPRGPDVGPDEAAEAVDAIRDAAARAIGPVRRSTGLMAPDDSAETVVVDRPAWLRSNVNGFRVALDPMLVRLRDRRGATNAAVTAIGSRATGLQLGAVLGWLSGKVLGQYEAFTEIGVRPRLLLVAPNIVHVERLLDVPSHDFRLWVALHEETHRVQFGAVPWLADHLLAEVHTLLEATDVDASDLLGRIPAALEALRSGGETTLVDAVQTPAQRAVFDRLTALMSLLEGHADHVMDDVGPEVVPSVALIRERFDQRRHNPGVLDGILRRLLGIDAKMRQYADGARFVRGVVERVGMEGFNQVWTSPDTLPTRDEITDPDAWVRRVAA